MKIHERQSYNEVISLLVKEHRDNYFRRVGGNKMKCQYGTDDSTSTTFTETTVSELINIIKNDVENGKWNIYDGGKVDSVTAHCRFQKTGYVYHDQLRIYGTESQFKKLEHELSKFMKVIPRKF